MRRSLIAVTIAVVLSTSPSHAAGGKLVGFDGAEMFFVWKASDAHSEAMTLIEAGVHKTTPRF